MSKDGKGVDVKFDGGKDLDVNLGTYHSRETIAKLVSTETGEKIDQDQIRKFTYGKIVNAVGPYLLVGTDKGGREFDDGNNYDRDIPVNSLTLLANPSLKNLHINDRIIIAEVALKAISKVSSFIASAIKDVNLERNWTVALPIDFGRPVEKAKKSNGKIQVEPQARSVSPDAE